MVELVTSVAAKLNEVLCHVAINKVCEMWGYKTQLEELKGTVSTAKAVLLDADAKWDRLSHQEKDFIKKLIDVVYDADDVFDEFLTLAELKQLDDTPKKHGNIFEKVRLFFSSQNQVGEAYRMSCEVKDIKKRLDAIASDRDKLKFGADTKPISRRPKETSCVNDTDIIGRDKDKEIIVNMLLAPNVSANAPDILAIVGVGGLGKTALAQFVFNDEKIQQEFSDPTSRLWVCVSDQDGVGFDDKTILCKILELVTSDNLDVNSSMQFVVMKFQENFRGKKFLLVLDDLWNEDRQKWVGLQVFLRMGGRGSKIIVTTRSHMTAANIGSNYVHKLDGLSTEYSQRLFEMTAFGEGHDSGNHLELIEIGKKIVEICHNIPLALKVVGSLLFGQNINKWRSIQESGLANIGNGDNGVLSVLKLSYHNLDYSLKSCFSYCALFPKDFKIEKEVIIRFWLAQGYIVPLNGGQNLEDAAEEYFIILLRRCFFQDVVIDEYGDVESVKIHDMMHDVAQKVAEEELCIVTSKTCEKVDKIRHVYIKARFSKLHVGNHKIRSYIVRFGQVDERISNCIRLRVLVLSGCNLESLVDSIGNLLHLRYLDLSNNYSLEAVCKSITKLYNLQTLNLNSSRKLRELPEGISKLVNLRHLNLNDCEKLRELPKGISKLFNLMHLNLKNCGELRELPIEICKLVNLRYLNLNSCRGLRELPKETSKLVNLRHLNIEECKCLTSMPSGLDKLSNLRVLGMFVVGYKSITNEEQSGEFGMLKHLKALNKIQGKMCVRIGRHYRNVEDINDDTEDYLKSMEYLRELEIYFKYRYEDVDVEVILEKLEPPPNLKELCLKGYKGKRIGRWGRAEDNWAISLPLLVHIEIQWCTKLEQLPVLSKLPHLKSLELEKLENLEYMENGMSDVTESSITQFFPSLETLKIERLPKLKGWCKVEKFNLYFPCLSYLEISGCPNLTSNIICPALESLDLNNNSERLQITYGVLHDDIIKLRTLTVSQVGHVKSIPINCKDNLIEEIENTSLRSSSFLQKLHISGFSYDDYEEEEEEEEPWKSFLNSLRELSFDDLQRMKRLPKGMQYLTSLQSLELWKCENMKEVPEWISCLSSLQSLVVENCRNIKTLPESFNHLTSLKKLEIYGCPNLKERCRKLGGEDFPKIQHIPHVQIDNEVINWRYDD